MSLQELITVLILALEESIAGAQTATPVHDDCGSTEENVNAVASALGICENLKQLLQPAAPNRTPQPGQLSEFFELPGTARPGAWRGLPGDRQRVDEGINQGGMESNLLLLRVDNARLQIQNSLLVDEAHAFRRSKVLNAWLGTGIQGAGTGLQLSSNISVQRAGNILGVVGGATTIVLAMCTAELDAPAPTKTALELVNSVSDQNQRSLIPSALWHYMSKDDRFLATMGTALPAPPSQTKKKKFLSCRYNKLEDHELAEISNRLTAMEKKIDEMMQAISNMSKQLDKPH